MLAGLRHGVTLGSPLALVIANRDHASWAWGMSPWPPENEPTGKGASPVTLPRPGHADLAGALKYGHEDVRNALERASARQTAAHVAAGAVAKALLREIGISVAGRVLEIGAEPSPGAWQRDRGRPRRPRHAGRDRRGRRRGRAARPRLVRGEGATARRPARRGADGDPGREGRRVGDGFALARLRGSEAHDEIDPGLRRRTNRAGGIEGGVTNGEPVVVRAAMKPLPTLMRPLGSIDLATGEPGQALVERSDVQAVEALAVVAEAGVAWGSRGQRGRSSAATRSATSSRPAAYLERIRWRTR